MINITTIKNGKHKCLSFNGWKSLRDIVEVANPSGNSVKRMAFQKVNSTIVRGLLGIPL